VPPAHAGEALEVHFAVKSGLAASLELTSGLPKCDFSRPTHSASGFIPAAAWLCFEAEPSETSYAQLEIAPAARLSALMSFTRSRKFAFIALAQHGTTDVLSLLPRTSTVSGVASIS